MGMCIGDAKSCKIFIIIDLRTLASNPLWWHGLQDFKSFGGMDCKICGLWCQIVKSANLCNYDYK